jgi:hypothetical protein
MTLAYMLFVVLSGFALLVYGWRSGAFKDIDEPARRMLEDREPEPWPGREQKQ